MKHGLNILAVTGCFLLVACQSPPVAQSERHYACPEHGVRACHRQWPPELPVTARGQEPGWLLGLDEEDLVLEYQYGEERFAAPTPEAEPVENGLRYRTRHQGKAFTLTLTRDYCEDSMSGMPYPYRAQVELEDRVLKGCAGESRQLLLGRGWTVQRLDNQQTLSGARPTLRFTAEGRLEGSAGCNRYHGRYRLTGEGLRIEGLAQTRMACAATVMQQEDEFLEVLAGTRRFWLEGKGQLVLSGPGERKLEAVRIRSQ